MNVVQETVSVASQAGATILETGVIGALLILSLIGNGVLIWRLIACYRYNNNQGDQDAL